MNVVGVSTNGKITATVTFPGDEAEAAKDAEGKLREGIGGLTSLSQNGFISGLGDLVLDTSGVDKTVIKSSVPIALTFTSTFSNAGVLVMFGPN